MSEDPTEKAKSTSLPFLFLEALSVIVVLYYLATSAFLLFHWLSGGNYLGALVGFIIESGILAFPFSLPFAWNFVARCKKHEVVISSLIDGAKTFNIIFLSLSSIVISGFLMVGGFSALISEIIHNIGVFCIPWFFVIIGTWEHQNNKRISVSIVENQIWLTLR